MHPMYKRIRQHIGGNRFEVAVFVLLSFGGDFERLAMVIQVVPHQIVVGVLYGVKTRAVVHSSPFMAS
jgi:hypothetical protein